MENVCVPNRAWAAVELIVAQLAWRAHQAWISLTYENRGTLHLPRLKMDIRKCRALIGLIAAVFPLAGQTRGLLCEGQAAVLDEALP